MKNFVKTFEKIFQDQKSKLLTKIRKEKIPVAWFQTPYANKERAKSAMDSLLNEGTDVRYMFIADENSAPPPRENLQIFNINKIAEVFPRPKYLFIFSDPKACAFVDRLKSLGIELIELARGGGNSSCYLDHMSDLYEVYNSLIDEESRRVFLAFLLGNSSTRISDYIFDPMPQYFLHGFMPQAGDILIDGGAFDGSSASKFKKYGCDVYAFELDKLNFENAKSRGDREGFVVENFGLGEHSQQIDYVVSGMSSHTSSNVATTKNKQVGNLISIDEYVESKNLPRIDFIKLDIEGSELDTLKGGAISIAKWKPRLAISAYHKSEDVYTLAQFLKSIRPDYEFAFRHYPTSFDNEPAMFGANAKEFLESHNLPLKIPYVWEAVLYAS